MFCYKCGTQLPEDAVFCGKCGERLQAVTENNSAVAMPDVNQIISEFLLSAIEKNVGRISNATMRKVCNAYAGQIVPEVSAQLLQGKVNFAELPLSLPTELQEELNKIASKTTLTVFEYVSSQMDDGAAKDFFNGEVKNIVNEGALAFVNNEDWQKCLKNQTISCASRYAKKYSGQAVEQAHQYFGEGQYSDMLCSDATDLANDIIDTVASGASLDDIVDLGRTKITQSVKHVAATYATENINHAVDVAVDKLNDKAKRKGRGQHRSRYNVKLNDYANTLRNSLEDSVGCSVQRLLDGENFGDVLKDYGKDVASQVGRTVLQDQVQGFVNDSVQAGIKHIRVSGKGSRGINREIRNFGSDLSDSATGHITENVMAVVTGEKSVGDAVYDTAVATGKDAAKEYARKNGARVVEKAIQTITVKAAKQIGNETVKQAVLKGGGALANVNVVTQIGGAVYDIGKSIKKFWDGEITEAELLRELGEKGTSACVSSVYAGIGGMIGAVGGPVGIAIGSSVGSMVGYMASSMLYGAILGQFERTEAARKYAEEVHAMIEVSIRRMKAERAKFELQVKELLHNRAQAALSGFKTMDEAILSNDFDKFSFGLNEIAKSFGQELQFTNFEEFDKFMESDEDFVL